MALMPPISLCEITLWQHLAANSELAERGRERADSSCLKSDMENVTLLSKQMSLISGSLPTQADTNISPLRIRAAPTL